MSESKITAKLTHLLENKTEPFTIITANCIIKTTSSISKFERQWVV